MQYPKIALDTVRNHDASIYQLAERLFDRVKDLRNQSRTLNGTPPAVRLNNDMRVQTTQHKQHKAFEESLDIIAQLMQAMDNRYGRVLFRSFVDMIARKTPEATSNLIADILDHSDELGTSSTGGVSTSTVTQPDSSQTVAEPASKPQPDADASSKSTTVHKINSSDDFKHLERLQRFTQGVRFIGIYPVVLEEGDRVDLEDYITAKLGVPSDNLIFLDEEHSQPATFNLELVRDNSRVQFPPMTFES